MVAGGAVLEQWVAESRCRPGVAVEASRPGKARKSLAERRLANSFEEEAARREIVSRYIFIHIHQMIVRRVLPCLRQVSTSSGNVQRQIAKYGRVQRRYSSTSAAGPAASVSSSAAPIASITSELDRLSPRFDVPAESIEILRTPAEFYSALKSKILNAKRRIYLSTLYVGKSEHELVCFFQIATKID
jgi:hypothetical protein